MPSTWRWCTHCRRWFYPDRALPQDLRLHCPVCQRDSVAPADAPGRPPTGKS